MPRKGPPFVVKYRRPDLQVGPGHQLTNKILERGKRTIAERIVYTALEQVEQKTGTDPVATLKRASRTFDRVGSQEPPRRCTRTRCRWRFVLVAPYTGYPC